MSRKYFGTDGVRGRVGEHPITADWILRLGRAAGIVLAGNDKRGVVIGKDTRVSGYMFESALEAGGGGQAVPGPRALGGHPDCGRVSFEVQLRPRRGPRPSSPKLRKALGERDFDARHTLAAIASAISVVPARPRIERISECGPGWMLRPVAEAVLPPRKP